MDCPHDRGRGTKGIGRLSSAALGPLLLVASKRRDTPFLVALIDWRLFENPFLYLEDIEIPLAQVDAKEDLFSIFSDLFDRLMGNLWGTGDSGDRDSRLSAAWRSFDKLEAAQHLPSTRAAIENVVIDTAFEERHFREWPLWRDEAVTGTMLAVSGIEFDLVAQLDRRSANEPQGTVKLARERLFHTMSNFSDPFVDASEADSGYGSGDFASSVTAWEGSLRRPVISDERQFGYRNLEDLEHVVEGEVDENGDFRGRVRAFGEWLEGEISIPAGFQVPDRSNSRVGPFHLRIGTFEQERRNTSHTEEVFRRLEEQAKRYAGLMIYRNGLRVMPYGREDNDFFEIEKRRSMHAGRAFWATRRLFGRVAIRRNENPNLKDKAGREGLIDNKAGKVFRDLVINILQTTGRKYFGTESENRKRYLPDIQEDYARRKAEEARNKQRAKRRKEFRSRLKRLSPELAARVKDIETLADRVGGSDLASEGEVLKLREQASHLKRELGGFTLVDRLRFLSPLKLSGEKAKTQLSGQDILDYVRRFFGDALSASGINLNASPAFLAFSVHELPSRVYPVFINLVNNAAYWVRQTSEGDNRILLDAVDGRIVVADDGPGVDADDLKHLFTLFFTRKVRGGRGVGLYLCRANLAAGGHGIEYATKEHLKRLPGANFVIDFKGARYD